MAKQRLQKILAAAGVDSRRNCEQLILQGLIRVNRKIVDELPAFADPDTDIITVNGKKISRPENVYFLLNKPKGVICTNADPAGRKKAIDLIDCDQRIFCVGRLDADTTGAVILTNDSELTNRLTHPKYEMPKTYEVKVRGRIEGEAIEKLKKGTWLAEGKTSRAAVKVVWFWIVSMRLLAVVVPSLRSTMLSVSSAKTAWVAVMAILSVNSTTTSL